MAYPTTLFNTVRARLSGSVKVMIDLEITNAARELCNRAPIWLEHQSIPQVVGTASYVVTPATAGAEAVFILHAERNRIPLLGWSGFRPMPDDFYSVADLRTATGIALSAPSTSIDAIDLTLQLRPTEGATPDLPLLLLRDYFEVLADGVLWRMYDHADRPYSDLEKAEYHRRKFLAGMGEARAIALRGRTMHSSPWTFPGYARGTGGRPSRGGF